MRGTTGELMRAWACAADRGPFSSVGVFDRLVYDSYDALTTLALAAGLTTRIRLATTVMIGPVQNDALLAKAAATIDALSNGRLTLGIALGARRDDYDAAGVEYHTRGRRLSAQLAALRAHWEDERFGPRPVQPGGPELLVGGLNNSAYARAARYADGYIHGGGPPRAFAAAADKARAAWLDAGRPGRPRLWAMGYYALGAAEAEAGAAYSSITTPSPAPTRSASPPGCSPRRNPSSSSSGAMPKRAAIISSSSLPPPTSINSPASRTSSHEIGYESGGYFEPRRREGREDGKEA